MTSTLPDRLQPHYGVWRGQAFDNTHHPDANTPDLPWESVLEFDPDNPVATWMSEQGFLVFDQSINLLEALTRYYERARHLSCGKCTPCRAGLIQIHEALENALEHPERVPALKELLPLAHLMGSTSLCGIGLSSAVPFIAAVEHFLARLEHPGAKSARGFFGVATAPCIEACPAHVNVPRYIDYIRDGRTDLATSVLLEHYPLVGTCGRVCVRPCESACLRGMVDMPVAIKDLKRFAADDTGVSLSSVFRHKHAKPTPYKVAIVGAGPAGLTCAYHLLQRGVSVDIFDDQDDAGGMARLGIPAYRLNNQFLRTETEIVKRLGGTWHFKHRLGQDIFLQDLCRDFDAVFLGLGCAKGAPLKMDNVELNPEGFYLGMDLLRSLDARKDDPVKPVFQGHAVVIGCGNVAMDCARSLRRYQSDGDLFVSYRRTRDAASADPMELVAAEEEGIQWRWLTSPVGLEVIDGKVAGLWVQPMVKLEAKPGEKAKVVKSDEAPYLIKASTVVAAIGQAFDATSVAHCPELKLDDWGNIAVDQYFQTSMPMVFAGGDAASGPTTLIDGMADGQAAAESIWSALTMKRPGFVARRRLSQMLNVMDKEVLVHPAKGVCHVERVHMPHLDVRERVHNFEEVELGLDRDSAQLEASRCMRCYRVVGVSTMGPIQTSWIAHHGAQTTYQGD